MIRTKLARRLDGARKRDSSQRHAGDGCREPRVRKCPRGLTAYRAAANTLNIADEWGFTWPCQFNPFNASDYYFSFGPVYEELAYVDSINHGAVTPWLATSWAWSNG